MGCGEVLVLEHRLASSCSVAMDYGKAIVWTKAMRLAAGACRAADRLPALEKFGMRAQISRSAVSVASNIAEGWSRESSREKGQFFAIAQGSLAELHTQLLLSRELGWLPTTEVEPLVGLIDEIARMLTTLRQRMRRRTAKPPRASPTSAISSSPAS